MLTLMKKKSNIEIKIMSSKNNNEIDDDDAANDKTCLTFGKTRLRQLEYKKEQCQGDFAEKKKHMII